MRAKLIVGGLSVIISAGVALGYFAGRARASGIPATTPLSYTGVLTAPTGQPLTGSKNSRVSMWDAGTNGNQVCTVGPASQALVAGGFSVVLPGPCTTAVRNSPDLWIEV